MKLKPMKPTKKYQLVRDGELYDTVYNYRYEADAVGNMLLDCGWIKTFEVVGVSAPWLSV